MSLIEKPEVQVILLAVVVVVVLLSAIAVTFARFYRRCGADEALVRTGSGGNKVVIGGGVVVYPILHQLRQPTGAGRHDRHPARHRLEGRQAERFGLGGENHQVGGLEQ